MGIGTDTPAARARGLSPRAGVEEFVRPCFHCGGPIAPGPRMHVTVDGAQRAMCCRGCQAVAQTIVDSGLARYYRLRAAPARKPVAADADDVPHLAAFDDPAIQQRFVERGPGDGRTASLILDGIHCPACCWLIERRLAALPGMQRAVVNFASQRATVTWDEARLRLSAILGAIARLGYGAHPYDPETRAAWLDRDRRGLLRRLGLAGLLGMQVMMFSIALYFRDWPGAEQVYRDFFRWMALLLSAPVVTYSAAPFFRNAWRDIRARRAGMDVPVALGIALAFLGSVHATFSGRGPVYFDSVVMFVFILLLGRYVELRVRGHALMQLDRLARIAPAMAVRLDVSDGGVCEANVPVASLRPGDIVLVRPGATVPADGVVSEGDSAVDEAILTGEGLPRRRRRGDRVIGGSANCESPLQIRVERVGAETVLAHVARLVEQGQARKPAITMFADRVAGWFVYGVLASAAVVAGYWSAVRPDSWLPITVAVLVVSCPCALALALPAALAAAIARSMRFGIIVARADAVETLPRATVYAFDKTGTLTRGRLSLRAIHPVADRGAADCLAVAAALERGSEHPIARALRDADRELRPAAAGARNHPGAGVTGSVDGRGYALGSRGLVARAPGADASRFGRAPERAGIGVRCWLADETGPLAAFDLADELRDDAAALVAYLKGRGCRIAILSGDAQAAVDEIGAALGADLSAGDLLPEAKVERLRTMAGQGDVVCMVGDGINDAPVLAAAHVSIAMAGATDFAQASADLILPERLSAIRAAVESCTRAIRVIRQNIAWAVAYNAIALPLAAAGWIAPWVAALGMSLSSLVVVANSARLTTGGGSAG